MKLKAANVSTIFQFNLVLKPQSLDPGVTYIFTLTCSPLDFPSFTSTATIYITTNAPPKSGQYLVTPQSGIELTTFFNLYAIGWSDVDFPISFQFSYQPFGSAALVLQLRSELSSSQSIFSSGNVALNCTVMTFVTIYDSLDANVSTTRFIGQSTQIKTTIR